LRKIGKAFNELSESKNIYIARIGGEEFSAMWFINDEATIPENVVPEIFKSIENLNIPHEKSTTAKQVTISVGVFVLQCGTIKDMDTVYKNADEALYEAKKSGRNCAVINSMLFSQYKLKP
jgi:diguanylate cyclase (GGDEF)-like protein